jgi:hypothetical protein
MNMALNQLVSKETAKLLITEINKTTQSALFSIELQKERTSEVT